MMRRNYSKRLDVGLYLSHRAAYERIGIYKLGGQFRVFTPQGRLGMICRYAVEYLGMGLEALFEVRILKI